MPYKDKKIAVIGVSSREDKFGYKIFRDLLKQGYQVKGVHPVGGGVLDQKIFRSLKDIPERIDLVITVVPANVTEKIIEQCNELGIKDVWMQPGSESELAIEAAKRYGITVTYNACFMVREHIW